MNENDPLKQLQLDITGRLLSHPLFDGVPVLCRAKGDIVSDVEEAIGTFTANSSGKSGLLASVLMPLVDVPNPNTLSMHCEVSATVLVLEMPALNAIGISAEKCGINVMAALHQCRCSTRLTPLVCDKRALEPFDAGDPAIVGYTVYFRTAFGINPPRKIVTPSITGAAAAVTLEIGYAPDADAEIYFTTDDTFPYGGNAAATKYTAPFAVTPGARVRAGAFKTNHTPSDIASALIGA